MPDSDGIIIILSYPDTIVRPAYWERLSGFWSKIGIGGKHAVQAGHAALLLLKKNNPEINYFDFGRYITSYGNGRVRCKETDPELVVSLPAKFKNNELTNLEEILLWIEKHPEKTHGEGRLVTSIHNQIDFKKAEKFIHNLINKKEVPYGTFLKNGSNCARFVTDTIITASNNKKIIRHLKTSNLFTPSPIGNVIKANTENIIYKIHNQNISAYNNRSILREYKDSFFNKFDGEPNLVGTEKPDLEKFNLKNATWLGGIGSGAWFKIEEKVDKNTYKIARYTSNGNKDFEGVFKVNNTKFNLLEDYSFIYPTNCMIPYILQNNETYVFENH